MRLAAALVWLAAGLTAAPAAADTAPRRLLAGHEHPPFAGVGRLDTGDGYCTATLISPTRALTAAHCLHDARGALRPTAALIFRAGFAHGGAQAVRQVRRAVAHPDWRWRGPFADAESIAADLALVELDQPVPPAIAGHLPGDLPPPGAAVALLSYGQGRDRALSLQDPCRVLSRQGAVARLDCEVAPGSSGAPVLARTPEGLRLVGVVAAMGGGAAFATVTAAALPALEAALAATEAPPRAVTVQGGGLAARSGGWKSVRPPAE